MKWKSFQILFFSNENKYVIEKRTLLLPSGKNWLKVIFEPPLKVKRSRIHYLEITSDLNFKCYLNYFDGYKYGNLIYSLIPLPDGIDIVARLYGINYVNDNFFGMCLQLNYFKEFWSNDTIFRNKIVNYMKDAELNGGEWQNLLYGIIFVLQRMSGNGPKLIKPIIGQVNLNC